MRVVRTALAVLVVVTVIAPQCNQKEPPPPAATPMAQSFTVHGVVSGSPPKGMPPGEAPLTGSAVVGAQVALRGFSARDSLAGAALMATVTDSVGAYRLEAPAGSYFLVVSHASVPYAMYTSGYFDKNFTPADSVQAYRVLELTGDREENIVLPQAWPQ